MRLPSVLLALAFLMPESSFAAAMNGGWKVDYPCLAPVGPSSPYAKRCAEGLEDIFEIELWSQGDLLCGNYTATAHLGNRIDEGGGEPSIAGRMEGNSATVWFHSDWGAFGHARIRVAKGKLYWDEIDRDGGISWTPRHAVLTRSRALDPKNSIACTGKLGDD